MEEKIRQLEKALRKSKKLNFVLMLYILLISLGMTIYFNQVWYDYRSPIMILLVCCSSQLQGTKETFLLCAIPPERCAFAVGFFYPES